MVNFALQTRKTSKNHDFSLKNQAKSLIVHGFPCQNFPTVNPSSRHAYHGGRGRLRWKSPTTSPPNKPTRGWRRSCHLRRVQRPRQGGTENDPETLRFPYINRCKSPLSECSFCVWNPSRIHHKNHPKRAAKKSVTNDLGRSWAAPGSCFGQPKRRYHS